MEVIPLQMYPLCNALGILHECGGDPHHMDAAFHIYLYSPRVWRWSLVSALCRIYTLVFSTYVEVILCSICKKFFKFCILHVCGGDPRSNSMVSFHRRYSPRMWRWSLDLISIYCRHFVFSTYVEVIPITTASGLFKNSILHVCGGDPSNHHHN